MTELEQRVEALRRWSICICILLVPPSICSFYMIWCYVRYKNSL